MAFYHNKYKGRELFAHITSALCTETYINIPFRHNTKMGEMFSMGLAFDLYSVRSTNVQGHF